MQQTLDVSVLPIFQTIMDQLAYQAVQFWLLYGMEINV